MKIDKKGRRYFNQGICERTGCIIFKCGSNVLMIKDQGDVLGFPGGTVEENDKNIKDTTLREFYEEVILADNLTSVGENGYYLSQWPVIQQQFDRRHIVNVIRHKLEEAKKVIYGEHKLKVIYFIIPAPVHIADYLIENYNMIPIDWSLVKMATQNRINHKSYSQDGMQIRRRDYYCARSVHL